MKLQSYLEKHKLTQAEFAERCDVSRQSVHTWVKCGNLPRWETVRRIEQVTKGQVTARDWARAAEDR